MTASRTVLAFAAAAISSTIAWSPLALAQSSNQTPPPAARATLPAMQTPGAASENLKPRNDAKVEARIAQLHKELKITNDQESDWNALAQDMRDNARQMASLLQERESAAKSKPMTAVDNLKSYEKITDAHAEGLKKITPDFEKLYNDMSPAQRKTADSVFNQRVNQRVRTTATPSSRSHS
jgi:periplasmic protein CpxP/Spy